MQIDWLWGNRNNPIQVIQAAQAAPEPLHTRYPFQQ
jgi:hypothetical protein